MTPGHGESKSQRVLGTRFRESRQDLIELRLDGGGPLELDLQSRLQLFQQLLMSVEPREHRLHKGLYQRPDQLRRENRRTPWAFRRHFQRLPYSVALIFRSPVRGIVNDAAVGLG